MLVCVTSVHPGCGHLSASVIEVQIKLASARVVKPGAAASCASVIGSANIILHFASVRIPSKMAISVRIFDGRSVSIVVSITACHAVDQGSIP